MDVAYDVVAYTMLAIGIPITLLSIRCIFVLCNWDYWKNWFCRIFVFALILNALTFWNVFFWLRASWLGLFPDLFMLIRRVFWMTYVDFTVRLILTFSTLLSLAMSANRFTAIYFTNKKNDEIWDPFVVVYLPFMLVFSGVVNYEHLMKDVEFYPMIDNSGKTRFSFRNVGLTGNVEHYWLCFQALLDAALNVAVIVKFIRIRKNSAAKPKPFEYALYVVSFSNFVSHCAFSVIQIVLRMGIVPGSMISFFYLLSNVALDLSTLLPPVFIIIVTKEIRDSFKKFFISLMTRLIHREHATSVVTVASH